MFFVEQEMPTDDVECRINEDGEVVLHGIGCECILCTDCGTQIEFREDTCPECGREEAG